MNVFLTGATGYIGHHCMHELLDAGHTVSALSRRDNNSTVSGVKWIRGSLETLEAVQSEYAAADVIVHCAMEYRDNIEASDIDAAAMKVLLASGKFIVSTGNLYTCDTGKNGLIEESLQPSSNNWRNTAEEAILANSAGGAIIRPSFVYGGTGGYFWQIFEPDNDGKVFYCGAGSNTWPMVHVKDLAKLFRFVAEQRAAGVFHAWDGHNISVADMAGVACKHQGGKLEQTDYAAAHKRLGAFASHMMRTIQPTAGRTAKLGWSPEHPSFEEAAAEAFCDYKANLQA